LAAYGGRLEPDQRPGGGLPGAVRERRDALHRRRLAAAPPGAGRVRVLAAAARVVRPAGHPAVPDGGGPLTHADRAASSPDGPAGWPAAGRLVSAGMTGFDTLAIHAGQEPDPGTGSVTVPIYQTSTYKQDGVGGLRGGYEYSRSANPTRTALETCLAALEAGTRGLAFASGMAAEDCLLRAALGPGDHVVIPADAYGGSYRLFARVLSRWGLEYDPVPLADLGRVRAALRPNTRMIWCETPTNPLLGVADIA